MLWGVFPTFALQAVEAALYFPFTLLSSPSATSYHPPAIDSPKKDHSLLFHFFPSGFSGSGYPTIRYFLSLHVFKSVPSSHLYLELCVHSFKCMWIALYAFLRHYKFRM